jgi:hypothetical protein
MREISHMGVTGHNMPLIPIVLETLQIFIE